MSIRKLNQDLEKGILPMGLNFMKKEATEEIDWNKVKYNTFYKENDYFLSKLPKPIHNLVGIDKIVELMREQSMTPLQEMEYRKNISQDSIADE